MAPPALAALLAALTPHAPEALAALPAGHLGVHPRPQQRGLAPAAGGDADEELLLGRDLLQAVAELGAELGPLLGEAVALLFRRVGVVVGVLWGGSSS